MGPGGLATPNRAGVCGRPPTTRPLLTVREDGGCIVLVLGVGRCAFRPPRVVFVLGLVSLINSLTSGKKSPFRIYTSPLRAQHGTTGWGLPSPPGRLHASHEGTSASRHASLDPRPFSAIRAGLIGAEKPAAAASGPYARGCSEGAACGCAGRRPKATGHVDSLGCRRSTSPSAFGSCGGCASLQDGHSRAGDQPLRQPAADCFGTPPAR